MKNIAIIGSSGGNLFNLGGREPIKLLNEIIVQAGASNFKVSDILYVKAEESMDRINEFTKAQVYYMDYGDISWTAPKVISYANTEAGVFDKTLSEKIRAGKIDALIVISADPSRVNKESITAASKAGIPIVGTGGASMAAVRAMGGNVVAVSGTTGTTNRTRAISFITSLSQFFDFKYRPVIGAHQSLDDSKLKERISFRGIMMSSLPGFIAMALVLALSKIPGLDLLGGVFSVLISALPVLVAAIAAKQVSGLDEVGICAGVIAGALSVSGGIIGGILGGILAGILAYTLISFSFKHKLPATTANIVAGGVSGVIAGLFIHFVLAPVTLAVGNGIRDVIELALTANAALAGLVAGLLIWPAIIGGVYHAAILPIVLLEMEKSGMSFLGAVDMVGLVMVSAGITLGNIIYPQNKESRAIAVPGFFINVGFGTFVEAAYPFMFSNKFIMAGAIVSAGVGGLLVGLFNVFGTAYVPALFAPALSNGPLGFAVAMFASMFTAMLITLSVNKMSAKKPVKKIKNP